MIRACRPSYAVAAYKLICVRNGIRFTCVPGVYVGRSLSDLIAEAHAVSVQLGGRLEIEGTAPMRSIARAILKQSGAILLPGTNGTDIYRTAKRGKHGTHR